MYARTAHLNKMLRTHAWHKLNIVGVTYARVIELLMRGKTVWKKLQKCSGQWYLMIP